MNTHGLIVGLLIASGAAVIALFVWRAFIGVKQKNNAELKTVLLKARAFSTISLWIIFLCWGLISFFIDADTTFTVSNVRTMITVLLGLQCVMELIAGIYYEKNVRAGEIDM